MPDDSDSDNGDGLLADLGDMVKGLPSKTAADSGSDSRALFSTSVSRPSSSHGYKVPTKPAPKAAMELSDDETDYKMLAPQQSPRRSIIVTAKEDVNIKEDSDDDIIPAKITKKAVKKKAKDPFDDGSDSDVVERPATKKAKAPMDGDDDRDVVLPEARKKAPAKKAPKETQPKTKKTVSKKPTAAPKKIEQSPVAKAYAKILDSDDEMDALADDILKSPSASDSDEPVAPKAAARAPRRAVTAKKAATYTFDDDDDEDGAGFNDDGSSAAFQDSD